MSGKAKPETLSQRLQRFYADNPGELLTLDDVCIKFDVDYRKAQATVKCLVKEKKLISTFFIGSRQT